MNFLNPLVLLALAATLIPLVLHFLTLRRLPLFPFSSVRFLKQLQQRAARRFRLRQLLLLAVRIGLVASLVLAFARPVLPGPVPVLGERAPASIVLVVDNSASMGLTDMHGERFRRLRHKVEQFLRTLRADDEVALLPVVPPAEGFRESWEYSRGALLETLSRLTPQAGHGDLVQALRRAAALVQDARHFHRVVVVLSDFQKSALPALSHTQRLFDARTTVVAVPLGQGESLPAGIVIDSVALESELRAPNEPVNVSVRVRSFGTGEARAVVSLFWDGQRIAQQPVSLREGETRTLSLSGIPERAGFFRATLVAEGDVHSIGHQRLLGFALAEPPMVRLAVDDAFRPVFHSVVSAPDRMLFQWEWISSGQLLTVPSSTVLLIASTALTAEQLQWLKSFLHAGGKVFVFAAGNSATPLLSWVSELGLTLRWHELPAAEAATITWADRHHPLFAGVFQGSGEQLPETPRLEKFFTVEGGVPLLKSTLGPVLVEQPVGSGRLLLCGISPERSWSEFPTSGLFPTTVVRGILLLGMATVPAFLREVGESVALTLGTASPTLVLREPDGTRRIVSPIPLSSGMRVELGQLRTVGVYELSTPRGVPIATITANIPAAELELTYASAQEVGEWFHRLVSSPTLFRYISPAEELSEPVVAQEQATELWRYFLVAALLLAAAEVALSTYGRRYEAQRA